MRYVLENEWIQAEFESVGAELKSLKRKADGQEYMWCADPAYWSKTSPFLFPFIGKTVNMEYSYNGKTWPAEKHGFGQKVAYDVAEQSDTRIVFRTKDTEGTYAKYPFHFSLDIEYVLDGESLIENWYVTNTGDNTMYFSIGGHAAFACPRNGHGCADGRKGQECDNQERDSQGGGKRIGQQVKLHGAEHKNIIFSLRANTLGLITEELLTLDIKDGLIAIDAHTFDNDALIFDGEGVMAIGLCDENGKEYVRVECGAPVWGVWSMPDNGASYVCLEPWYGLCDYEGFEGELSERPYANAVEPGRTWKGGQVIKVGSAL